MRQIDFQTLWIEDFKAISTPISLELDKFAPGCHSVRGINKYKPRMGSNGVSKSSLWDAFCFALYGKTPIGKRGPALVPWGQKVNPTVILVMSIDGEEYHIQRNASPHKLVVNGTPVEQAYLDQLLGIPFPIFTNTVLLAQGQDLFLDMTPTAKLTMLTEVLGLDRWDVHAQTASNEAFTMLAEMNAVRYDEAKLSGQIEATSAEIERLTKASEEHGKRRDEEIKVLTRELAKVEDEAAAADGVVQAANKAMQTYEATRKVLETALGTTNKAKQDAEVLHAQAKHLKDHIVFLKTNDECPTCGQTIGAKHRAHTLRGIEEALSELPPMARLVQAANKAMKDYADYEAANRDTTQKYYQASSHLLSAKRKLENARNRLVSAQHTNDPHASGLSVASIKLKGLKKSHEVAGAKLDAMDAERGMYDTWAGAFRAIKLLEVEDLLDTLSLLTSSYASQIGLECTTQFAVEREGKRGAVIRGINLTVDGIGDFQTWSVGEVQRLRLATSMALAHGLLEATGVTVPLRILDEPSAHLSPEGLKELATFLDRHGQDENMAVFLTDQRPVAGVTSVVTLTRTPDGVDLALEGR